MHYNGANSYLFVNSTEIYKFTANDSEIVASPLCLGIVYGDAGLTILQIFGKVLELKLKKIRVVLYSMIKIT